MKRNHKKNGSHTERMELKYCEHCGSLWVRLSGTETVYCEKCLPQVAEFSRQLIARHVLQEHDRWATARLLHCNEKTVRRLTPMALDQLCEILLKMGLMERIDALPEKTCQGGLEDEISVSGCEESENNF